MINSKSNIVDEIAAYLRARYPLLWIKTHEELRAIDMIRQASQTLTDRLEVLVWTLCSGLRNIDEERVDDPNEQPGPDQILNWIDREENMDKKAIYVLLDFHRFMGPEFPYVYRKLRDLYDKLRRSKRTIIIIAPELRIPIELDKQIAVIDLPLPNKTVIRRILETCIRDTNQKHPGLIKINEAQKEAAITAALGLTEFEADNVFHLSIVKTRGKLDPDVISTMKKQIIEKDGKLQFWERVDITEVGGLDNLKRYLELRKGTFSDEARKFGLEPAKGIILVGPPGTGKTLFAKACAKVLGVPLLRFDPSKVTSKWYGEAEQNISAVLKLAEAVAPVVLVFDEIEKILAAGQGGGATTAHEATMRQQGILLTWMQEQEGVYCIGTCNAPWGLSDALIRPGRFDNMFFVDLPTQKEREEIFAIHIRKRGRNPEKFDLQRLAEAAREFSGAEIEGAVREALMMCWPTKAELTTEIILQAIENIIPVAKKKKEEYTRLRDWARVNAIPASTTEAKPETFERAIEI